MIKLIQFVDEYDKEGTCVNPATEQFNKWMRENPYRQVVQMKYEVLKDYVYENADQTPDSQKRIYITFLLVMFNEFGNNAMVNNNLLADED